MLANQLIYTRTDGLYGGVWRSGKCVVLSMDSPHYVEDQCSGWFSQIIVVNCVVWQISYDDATAFVQTIAVHRVLHRRTNHLEQVPSFTSYR